MRLRTWHMSVFALVVLLAGCASAAVEPNADSSTASPEPSTTTTMSEVSAENGAKLATTAKCTNCHSADGTPAHSAPTLFELAGSTVVLADGSTVNADSDYIRRSIADPAAEIVEGEWTTAMPTSYYFSEAQIDSLVLWVESLRP